ncbi:NAD-dependent epimerase/dehydratase family protein [Undibacterium sp. RTI2.1]|uniref:NAD-dependent epimerase/dehydratase family protein n=1 Tax=unclassified Undibacterium TaxID=2630295 RepID=UPI002AB59CE7|nr:MULTISPECIES: NAD-dependent epimerase/dehydratase family protein [unclassified Undibacterium]MDY7540144.1 NAD-dependent epimerase/dehydratase family protein [Undibacterium sp. 5I1]MEB0030317.1 NAD-dependent epimerase/dehydratase family protein [Undibacterium sp. RTI2.1]MEB0115403.1 NAD-dependent epimerase/dehydratase family protein [Undibacterium sp. RTI2.2]MEB0230609.1 NAD-dependent epimerase/dehydratase family protein [Undibacterium sp. 10I3]MEB0257071.1 NAD-dependent epimerase/dehydratas
MHILITGANGFVGSELVKRLLENKGSTELHHFNQLTLVDMAFDQVATDARVHQLCGSIGDPGVLIQALQHPVDYVFHLASIPGGAAEANYELGLNVNLQASLQLLELLRIQSQQGRLAKLVFASSVAVYGTALPALIDDTSLPRPVLSYGTHKLAIELLLEDYSRRGWINGCALRLPGIVARPTVSNGLMSAFMSDIFWRLRDGQPFTCPVSAQAVMWWMSRDCCVNNLLHAASLDQQQLANWRVVTPPVLHLTISELVNQLASMFGADRLSLINYQPNPKLEAIFGVYPPINTSTAEAMGFSHDGSIKQLVENAVGIATK